MDWKKCGTLDFIRRWCRLTCKNRRILHKMALCGAFTIRFPCRFSLTIWSLGVENSAVGCRVRFRTASFHKLSPWGRKLSWFSANLIFPRSKAKNAGRFRKNAGMREGRQNAGFPARLRDGWHLCISSTLLTSPQNTDHGKSILVCVCLQCIHSSNGVIGHVQGIIYLSWHWLPNRLCAAPNDPTLHWQWQITTQ